MRTSLLTNISSGPRKPLCSPSLKRAVLFLICLALTAAVAPVRAAATEPVYTFGVAPQSSATLLAAKWVPFLQHLSKTTGVTFKFRTAPSNDAFALRLANGEYDVAYQDPFVFNSLPKTSYVAFAKPKPREHIGQESLGFILVHKESRYKKLEDLQNLTVAFPSPLALSSSIMPQFHIKAIGIDIRPKYVKSDLSAILNVTRGLAAAAGVEIGAYLAVPQELRDQSRVIWTTKPSHLCEGLKNLPFVFAAHRSVPVQLRKQLESALTTNSDPALLHRLGFAAIENASNADWQRLSPLSRKLFGSYVNSARAID
ncbi:MAG: phosphate/phosphite/phosphonate ABC transporter substrate-binding protein [Rhodospirillaceae bacterium]|nr:phosphate/phosphite/phosphonate ABC transporter substrate-binding protein [Rhodospirillaceae bacterium]MDD9918098.1 phosphate/phosphite/phosphonate ABC transporter substrate-binding protein [Rhodospirillaceae bacterium]